MQIKVIVVVVVVVAFTTNVGRRGGGLVIIFGRSGAGVRGKLTFVGRGLLHNSSLCEAHFSVPLPIIIAQSLNKLHRDNLRTPKEAEGDDNV